MYAFDPELTEPASRLPRVDYADLGTARAAARAIAAHQQPYSPATPVRVTDTRAPGPPDAPDVPVRLYRPAVAGPVPALLYLHWGGFVIGGVDGVHHTCVRIADQVGALVVSVDYRLAPEHPFPAALDDCHAVLEWVAKEATELGVDADRIGVGGESAGGGLAAALCLAVRDRGGPALRHQCLLFPALDDRLDTVSARAFTDTPMWDRANALVSWGHYLRGRAGAADVPALAPPPAPPTCPDFPQPSWWPASSTRCATRRSTTRTGSSRRGSARSFATTPAPSTPRSRSPRRPSPGGSSPTRWPPSVRAWRPDRDARSGVRASTPPSVPPVARRPGLGAHP
ncbi:alpha/beta hydrolase fold domain-containing protein [Micromonospora sp. 4G55]|nr:alpha/beta hydrolase fold domain-containing protein [Micromonospora sp. 4G55]